MSKIHVFGNKTQTYTACASRSLSGGKVIPNSRSTYRHMSSEIVSGLEFRFVPIKDRCAHCCDRATDIMNYQRKAKGLAPLASIPFVERPAN